MCSHFVLAASIALNLVHYLLLLFLLPILLVLELVLLLAMVGVPRDTISAIRRTKGIARIMSIELVLLLLELQLLHLVHHLWLHQEIVHHGIALILLVHKHLLLCLLLLGLVEHLLLLLTHELLRHKPLVHHLLLSHHLLILLLLDLLLLGLLLLVKWHRYRRLLQELLGLKLSAHTVGGLAELIVALALH